MVIVLNHLYSALPVLLSAGMHQYAYWFIFDELIAKINKK